jgi:hypothetical protein
MVIDKGEQSVAKEVFYALPPKWQKTILKELDRGLMPPGSRVPQLKTQLIG